MWASAAWRGRPAYSDQTTATSNPASTVQTFFGEIFMLMTLPAQRAQPAGLRRPNSPRQLGAAIEIPEPERRDNRLLPLICRWPASVDHRQWQSADDAITCLRHTPGPPTAGRATSGDWVSVWDFVCRCSAAHGPLQNDGMSTFSPPGMTCDSCAICPAVWCSIAIGVTSPD